MTWIVREATPMIAQMMMDDDDGDDARRSATVATPHAASQMRLRCFSSDARREVGVDLSAATALVPAVPPRAAAVAHGKAEGRLAAGAQCELPPRRVVSQFSFQLLNALPARPEAAAAARA